ncbi:MAG: class I SAM-dependent methyltransferase [Lachnospiraceae bacterium]|nr:class I SAM-dependent methyltransferase [Lachnospiraceae bacterium]
MIDTNEVIQFFDRLAPNWDADMVRNENVIKTILDNAGVQEGKDILDVACGTGVLIPDYISRGVASVTAIDISPKMVEIAQSKFISKNMDITSSKISIICGDVETYDFEEQFDSIVVYNAFPHFPNPDRLIAGLVKKLKSGGILTIAHGMSREKINSHHKGSASHVSNGLMPVGILVGIFAKYLSVDMYISDDRMYQVCGNMS